MKLLLRVLFISCCVLFLGCKNDATVKNKPTQPPSEIPNKGASGTFDKNNPPPAVEIPHFNADSAYQFIAKQVAFGKRVPGTPPHKETADWLLHKLETYADEAMVQKANLKLHDGTPVPMYNIIGSINPASPERIILAAHWDTRRVADQDDERTNEPIDGANDGASGVGVLLEIARQMQLEKPSIGVDFIFFDVEDQGQSNYEDSYCLGSQYWSKNPHKPGYSAKHGILLDMVGAGDATFLKEAYSLEFAASVVNDIWNTAKRLGYGSYFVNKRTNPITDDHYYVNTLAQIPMIDIIHYNNSRFGHFWHTHDDNMNIINKGTLQAVGDVLMYHLYAPNMAAM